MRLQKIIDVLNEKKIHYEYYEEFECASIDILYRGLSYHIWEFMDGVRGAETNVFSCGRSEDLEGDYEDVIAEEIARWPAE